MTNLDKLKAKIANMDSQQLADLLDELMDGCFYCAISSIRICQGECSEGFKLWLDLEIEQCKACLCNECYERSSNGVIGCLHCIDCLQEDERDVIRECDYCFRERNS